MIEKQEYLSGVSNAQNIYSFFFSKAYGCFTQDEEKMQHHFCSLNATKIFGVYGAEIALMGVEFLICVITSYQICISKCGGSIRGL